ncbi:MAG: DNA alkylation repair protein [Bacteroidota bacterium]|nr:DNA alkylation repair protein [Bacteroidota bacterium]
MASTYLSPLSTLFQSHANAETALWSENYMRGQFHFYGLSSPVRRELQKQFFKEFGLPSRANLEDIVRDLWQRPHREYQYFGMELLGKFVKHLRRNDILFFEELITHKSWWDTIDYIAPNLVGAWFREFPKQGNEYIDKWLSGDNIWLKRTAIIFQLKYKKNTDTELLFRIINKLAEEREFFIRKAIGWSLREYSKADPEAVVRFVEKNGHP